MDVLAGKIVLTDCSLVCIVNVREYDPFLSSSVQTDVRFQRWVATCVFYLPEINITVVFLQGYYK